MEVNKADEVASVMNEDAQNFKKLVMKRTI